MAGYRSYAFRWFTGYAVPSDGPEPPGPSPESCACPPWKVDSTLQNAFTRLDEGLCVEYTKPATLVNAWVRKGCG